VLEKPVPDGSDRAAEFVLSAWHARAFCCDYAPDEPKLNGTWRIPFLIKGGAAYEASFGRGGSRRVSLAEV